MQLPMRRYFYLDIHIFKLIIQRGWNIIAGAITVILIPIWFTGVEQGYYFTFLSLLALQAFFEMGFSTVIGQFFAHEVAFLKKDGDGFLSGDRRTIKRVQALLILVHKWYLTASLLFFIFIGSFGVFFFQRESGLFTVEWLNIWVFLVFMGAANLYISPYLAILEAVGYVGEVAQLRLIQTMIGYPIMWILLTINFGLGVVVVVPTISAFLGGCFIYKRGINLRQNFDNRDLGEPIIISWRHEILPMQWKIALSWMGGYLAFQAITPIIFMHQGAVEAGRVGLAFSIFNAISLVGMSWSTAAMPQMIKLIAHNKRVELINLFDRVLKSSEIFIILILGAFLITLLALNYFSASIVDRLPRFSMLVCMALVAAVNNYIFTAANFMRAHKQEPMLTLSLVSGLMILGAIFYASQYSVGITIAAYTGIIIGISFPWTALLLKNFKK
ncbi:hypothetical protein [Polynucleobacter sp. es-EL-1]|uniref:hypothetical protein n=1 Tax=Polynucleobacter sp. es-EL-1 TaxID=1855652 RepID=UPI001BFE14CD|nr:hypothetical protein [Polynucleobacter sp. es-EL-1]QWE10883.1 hypothetical protein FD974_01695 [Polynucleobacter sp. es-EL-1]